MCQEFETPVDERFIPRIGFGFAGGLGNTGEVCGAVSGAVMAIGVHAERGQSMEDMFRIFGLVQEFRRRFEAELETISCRELTGLDLTTEEGLGQLMESEAAQAACFTSVGVAFKVVVDVLKEAAS